LSDKSIVVVGLGSIGQRHLRNLRALGVEKLMAVSRSSRPLADAELLNGVRIFQDLDTALEHRPSAVLVATPTSLHLPVAQAAAARGCHLFIEKPLSDSLDGVDELIRTVDAKKLAALVGYSLRFHPALIYLRGLISEGRIGRVLSVRAEVGQYLPDWHPWEDYRQGYSASRALGGGVILDLSHEIDYLYWLFGPARRVFCLAGKHSELEIDTEDVAEILMECERAPIVEIHLDYLQRVPSRSCQVIGELGTIRWGYYANRVDVQSPDASVSASREFPAFERNQMFLDEMAHFLRCLDGRETPVVSLAESRQSLEIALAALQSSRDGRVCHLPRHLEPAA
jgi:predicted dehydrogenase